MWSRSAYFLYWDLLHNFTTGSQFLQRSWLQLDPARQALPVTFGARNCGFAPWTTSDDEEYGTSYKNVGDVLGLGPW